MYFLMKTFPSTNYNYGTSLQKLHIMLVWTKTENNFLWRTSVLATSAVYWGLLTKLSNAFYVFSGHFYPKLLVLCSNSFFSVHAFSMGTRPWHCQCDALFYFFLIYRNVVNIMWFNLMTVIMLLWLCFYSSSLSLFVELYHSI